MEIIESFSIYEPEDPELLDLFTEELPFVGKVPMCKSAHLR